MKKKLLLISNKSAHTYNYINLIKDYFDDILLITNEKNFEYPGPSIEVNFSLRQPLILPYTIKSIKEACRNFNPNIIHIHQANTCAYLSIIALKEFKIPIVLTAYGSDVLLTPKQGFFYKQMVKYNLRNSQYYTSDSLYMASVMEGILKKNIDILIANFGINVSDTNIDKENIIYSNRLHKKLYRIDEIIKAFSKFLNNKKNENWRLIVAGEGEETNNLKQLTQVLNLTNKVEFVGWLNKDKNTEYYKKSKIFISIPESDATSISLLEAMYYKCVPVVSNLPANLEWIIDEFNGVVVENTSANFIEKALNLDIEKLKLVNDFLIKEKALPGKCKRKFIGMYEKIYNNLELK